MASPGQKFQDALYLMDTADNMAFSHWYDRKEISNGELLGVFAECCIRGPGGSRYFPAHEGPAHEGPGGPLVPGP